MASVRPLAHIGFRVLDDIRRADASHPEIPTYNRIMAGVDWLSQAQDHGADDGFSYGYTIRGGWQDSYVETTGYIIGTFLDVAKRFDRPDLARRAEDAGEWLLGVQLGDGSFPNPSLEPESGLVFDTGQDLHGLLDLAEQRAGDRYDRAARRAATWLVEIADDNGLWTRNTFNGIPHVYNARSAWALVRAAERFENGDAMAVARANLDWACDKQRANGWFDDCAFTPGVAPYTHTTAYAGRGLLESGLLLGDERYIDAARQLASAASRHLDRNGRLPGTISVEDKPTTSSTCLTGSAQFAMIWLILEELDGQPHHRKNAVDALQAVGRQQRLTGPTEIRGAIKGSAPMWGRYAPLGYPNWATKFFVDALLRLDRGES